jgi:DNA/RNA-binding domain of Phe-tRNA-synthetase-like protein
MSRSFSPAVTPAIFELRPDYCALSLMAEGIHLDPGLTASAERPVNLATPETWPTWGDAHLEAWRDAYRGFGAKPQRTPPSVEALVLRLRRDGALPAVNTVVDLYNAISVRFAVPIGGENIDAYVSSPILGRATGSETFDTTRDGNPHEEAVPAGEIAWADERGVTCRRWNWRQGVRTRIDLSTTRMWFVLERLEPMPIAALLEAGHALASGLKLLSPEAMLSGTLIDRSGSTLWLQQDQVAPSRHADGGTGPA